MLRKYRLDVFAPIWLAYAFLVQRFWFVTDDAYISFRYSRNLLLGHGLRYNPGEAPPVEGYSNFLWVLVGSAVQALGLEITFWVPLLSSVCGSVLLFLVFDLLRRRLGIDLVLASVATLALGFFPPFAAWSSSGLETVPFALLIYLTFERLVLREEGVDPRGGAICAILTGLIRAEGFAWVAVISVLAVVSRWMRGQRELGRFVTFGLYVASGAVAYLAWRYAYHGDLVPNTAHAKTGLPASYMVRGFRYVAVQFLTFLTPFLFLAATFFALRRRRVAVGLPVALMAWAFPIYSIVVKGDFMTMGRFLIPGFVFGAIVLGWMLQDLSEGSAVRRNGAAALGLAAVVVGALPGWNLHLVPHAVRERFHFRFNAGTEPEAYSSELDQWDAQRRKCVLWATRGRALNAYAAANGLTDCSLVTAAIGATGYYADMLLYDVNGLVTPEVARRPFVPGGPMKSPGHDKTVSFAYFLKDSPTFLKVEVLATDERAVIADRLELFARPMRSGAGAEQAYVADFARLDEPDPEGHTQYLILFRRLGSDAERADAWQRFDARLAELRSSGAAPELSLPPSG